MKKIFLLLLLLGPLYLGAQEKNILLDKSSVLWKGYKVTGAHQGSIAFLQGNITWKKNKPIRGSFIVDMRSIQCTDLKGKAAASLVAHLESKDFFDSATYPKATLEFKTIEKHTDTSYNITADLTIKNQTHTIDFVLNTSAMGATATLKIDRTLYDIRYGSGSFFDNLGNKTIANTFDLIVNLVF